MPNLAFDSSQRTQPKRVLLVDRSDDARDVIRTILERRGVEIIEAPSARAGLDLLKLHRPQVVVLDLETEAADDDTIRAAFDDAAAAGQAEMVILGNLRRDSPARDKHVLSKPYHYGPLIEMIEELVRDNAPLAS